jgi:hypothetical protein
MFQGLLQHGQVTFLPKSPGIILIIKLFLLFYSLNNDRYWKHLSREFINRNCSPEVPVRSGCICDHSILASIYHKLSEENDNFCISVNGISTAA